MYQNDYRFSQETGDYEKVLAVRSVIYAQDFVLSAKQEHRPLEPSAWELIYVERGSLIVGSRTEKIRLEPNSLVILHDEPYTLDKGKDNEDVSGICLDFLSFSVLMEAMEKKKFYVNIHNRKYLNTLLREYQMTRGYDAARWGKAQKLTAPLGGEQTCVNRLEILLIELKREENRRGSSSILPKDNITNRTVIRIINMLEERVYDKITLDEISDRISYSKSYLSRLFHSVCGYSIMEYYMMMKIEEAKRLIREYSFNFSQIAERLRFDNPHYFSVVFKRVTGMTPSEYARVVRQD